MKKRKSNEHVHIKLKKKRKQYRGEVCGLVLMWATSTCVAYVVGDPQDITCED